MGRKAGSHTIDGKVYEITQLSPKAAQRVLVKISKFIGPALGDEIGDAATGKSEILDSEVSSAFGKILPKLFNSLNEADTEAVVEAMLGCAGKTYDSVEFQGNLMHMYRVVYAALEVNYSDFFEGVSGVLKRIDQPAPGTIQENAMPTGLSGVSSSKGSQRSRR